MGALPLTRALIAVTATLMAAAPAGAETCCAVMPMVTPPPVGGPPPMLVPISPIYGSPSTPPVVPPSAPAPVFQRPAALAPAYPAPTMTAPTITTPAAPMPVARGTYTVKKGARLIAVAQRTHTRFADLLLLNPDLSIDRKLPAGTRVLLPVPGSW